MTAQQQDALNHAHASERCHHVHLTGRQCGSPALSGHRLCYYHQQTRRPKLPNYKLPLLEDAASVQFGLVQVARALEDKAYDTKTGALLLYALQTASANLKRLQEEREHERLADEREQAGSGTSTESFRDLLIRGLGLRPPDPALDHVSAPPFADPLEHALGDDFSEEPNDETDHKRPGANVKHEPSFDDMFPLDSPAPQAPPTRRGPASETPCPAGVARRHNSA